MISSVNTAHAESMQQQSDPEKDLVDFSLPVDWQQQRSHPPFFATLPAGIRVDTNPSQTPLAEYTWHKRNHYEIGYSDAFNMSGLVISMRHYIADARADIAPYDMVVGWKSMSDPAILKEIDVRQNNRFYYWHVQEFPIPREELELNSTNLHLIPDTPEIAQILSTMTKGQVIELSGYLVDVKSEDGFIWSTSRVRNDTGDGACEIVLVKQIQIKQLHQDH